MKTTNVPSSVIELNQQKVAWLVSQTTVDYPTRGSVLGRACYLDLVESSSITRFSLADHEGACHLNWIEVDFHKMTVMFAQFMALHAPIPESQREFLQEFLAQIILSTRDQHRLYLAFSDDTIMGSALVSIGDDALLITDCLLLNDAKEGSKTIARLAHQVLDKEQTLLNGPNSVFVQCFSCS